MSSTPLLVDDPRLEKFAKPTFVLAAIFIPITTLALALRFYARLDKGIRLALDDYLAALSYVTFLAFAGCQIWSRKNGGSGYPLKVLPVKHARVVLTNILLAMVLTVICMTAAKFSILALYMRVFNPDRSVRFQTWFVAALCLAWAVAAIFTAIFACSPIPAMWDPIQRANPATRCINLGAFIVGIEVPNGVLDFVVAAIAINALRKVQMARWQKVSIGIIFATCTFVALVGFLRIGVTFHPTEWHPDSIAIWTIVQNAFTVICCCLPTYGSLIRKLKSPWGGLRSLFSRGSSQSEFSRLQGNNDSVKLNTYPPSNGESSERSLHLVPSGQGSHNRETYIGRSSTNREKNYGPGEIKVHGAFSQEVAFR